MNLDNLNLNKLKKDLQQFKKYLIKDTKIDYHTLDYCIIVSLSERQKINFVYFLGRRL